MYEYKATIRRVVDGDTVDVTLDLGFDILYNNRIRLLGIDTSEIRTRDLEEKALGLAAKDRVKELCPVGSTVILKTTKDDRGKFGRILGEIFVDPDIVGEHINECIANDDSDIDLDHDGWVSVNDILIEEGHAYEYYGGKKKDFEAEMAKEKEASFGDKK